MNNGTLSASRSPSKTIRLALILFVVCLSLSVACSCAWAFGRPKRPDQPPRELCVVGDAGLVCFDPRLPVDKQSYVLPFPESVNYIATNPVDYDAGQEWVARNCLGPR